VNWPTSHIATVGTTLSPYDTGTPWFPSRAESLAEPAGLVSCDGRDERRKEDITKSARRPPGESWMELSEALKRRSMCRKFDSTPVERDKLEKLVHAANRAPQGGNMPVREYLMVDDPRYVKLLKGVTPSFLANAPAALVICTDLSKALDVMGVQGRDVLSLLDAGAAAENVALEAEELGLGVSFVRSATTEAAKKVLGIPERYRVDIIVGIGYKSRDRPPPMKGSRPTIHHNVFGAKWDDQA